MNEIKEIQWPGWETVRLIGRGGFGTVYEIQRTVFGQVEKAALKVMSIPHDPSDIDEMYSDGYDDETITSVLRDQLKGIVAEYSLMRKMSGSANVVSCDDVKYIPHKDRPGWDVLIKMELLTPLSKSLQKKLDDQTVIEVGIGICNALELCKQYGIIHRDIKPQNIFVSPHGDYKLGDFGIAKTIEKTMGGTRIGTFKYMAPEVFSNRPYGASADIYSLGLVLYWMLNEFRLPFFPLPPKAPTAAIDEEARRLRLTGAPIPAPAHGSDELKRIVLKACAFDPRARYASATEMKSALLAISKTIKVPPVISRNMNGPGRSANTQKQVATGAAASWAGSQRARAAAGYGTEDNTSGRNRVEGYGAAQSNRPAPMAVSRKENPPVLIGDNRGRVPPPNSTFAEPQKKKKKGKIVVIVGIGVCLTFVLICCMIIPLLFKEGPGEKELLQAPTTTNSTTAPTTLPTTAEDINVAPGDTAPVQLVWTQWSQSLPTYVSAENYLIEERTLYSSRKLETQSSTTTNYIDGWEMYNTVSGNSEFGQWSQWSTEQVNATSSREVESTEQYSYRTIEQQSRYSDWGAWSSWSEKQVKETDLIQIEKREKHSYSVHAVICSKCGFSSPSFSINCVIHAGDKHENGQQNATMEMLANASLNGVSDFDVSQATNGYFYCVSEEIKTNGMINVGETYVAPENGRNYKVDKYSGIVTEYRYRERSVTYETVATSDWSGYSDSKPANGANTEIRTRTVYRYRDRVNETTYYFRRWTEWSDYTTDCVVPSDTVQVETKTEYRFKSK